MEDLKQRRRQILSWVAVVLILWTLLFVLVGNYLNAAKKEAVSKAEESLKDDVYTWSAQVNSIMQTGAIVGKILGEDGLTTAEGLEIARTIVSNTPVIHIYQVKDDVAYLCEDGEMVPGEVSVSVKNTSGYVFVDNFSVRGSELDPMDSLLIVLDSKDGEHLVLQIPESYIETNCFEDSHREVSFLSVADRLGNISITFDSYRDRTSTFFTNLNFLDNVNDLKGSHESAGQFKTCYISGVGSAIIAEYKNEKRMLVTSPIGDTGYSLVYGVRYSYVENYIESYYDASRDIMIKIIIVVIVFSTFIIGVILLTTFRNKERGRELETKADTDLLTELYNKLATERKIQEYLSSDPEGRGLMFILDIDNFKKINDTMGHAFGDTLLRTLGKEIKAEFRATDIIGRTGGDEFIVFLKNLNDDASIEHEANRLLRFFQDFKAGGDYVKYSATASIGAAIFPDDAANFKDLYVAADKALYRAKKRGKNQLCFYKEK